MRDRKVAVKNFVIGLTVVSSLFFVHTVNAETKEEIQSQRTEIQSDIETKEAEMQELKEELISLNEEIMRFEEAVATNEERIQETANEIEATENEIADLDNKIAEIQDNIDKRHEILKERISSLQENGGSQGYIEVLLGATDFVDFIGRVTSINTIAQADQELIESQEKDKLEVEKAKSERNDKLAELEAMQAEFEEMHRHTLEQKEKNEALKEELKEKERANEELLKDLKIEDEILAKKEEALQEAEHQRQEQQLASNSGRASASVSSDSTGSTKYSRSSSPSASLGSGPLQTAMNAGKKYIGNSVYVFGAGRSAYDVANGRFDCSGFVSWAFRQAGVDLPSSTAGLASVGSKVSPSNMQPGDLVFFNTYKTNGHVGIYLGNNQFIGAQSSTGVAIADMGSGYWKQKFAGHVRRVAQ